MNIIPSPPAGPRATTPSPALKKLYTALHQINLPGATARLSFLPPASSTPDFLVTRADATAFLISAVALLPDSLEELLHGSLLSPSPDTATFTAAAVSLPSFHSEIPALRILYCPLLRDGTTYPDLVLATSPSSLEAILATTPPAPLTEHQTATLRSSLCPESSVPSAFLPRTSTIAETRASSRLPNFTPQLLLLDTDQESWVKNDLLLPDATSAGAALPEESSIRARLITGPAGSGKSLALLYRAQLTARFAKDSPNILFTTHNKPLAGELAARLARINQRSETPLTPVSVLHFFRWCGKCHFDDSKTLIPAYQRTGLIRSLRGQLIPKTTLPDSFFLDEIDFIADQVDDSLPAYLELQRTGRGTPLTAQKRERFHRLYSAYRSELQSQNLIDYPGVVRRLWERVRDSHTTLPVYDHIFVDEAQFFAPVWFAILKHALHPERGQMILAADPTQGFLKRRTSWLSVGLDVQGRSTRLHRTYRSVPTILAFARNFYVSRLPDDHAQPDTLLPDPDTSPNDPDAVEFIHHQSPQDQHAWVAAEIRAATHEGIPPEAFLVLHEDHRQLDTLAKTLNASLLGHADTAPGTIAAAPLNSATGLERPIVILLGIDSLLEKENDPTLTEGERTELVRDHTRKIYMAITRAGQKLLISHLNPKTRQILQSSP